MYWIDGTLKQVMFIADSASDVNNLPTMTTEGTQQGVDNVSNNKVAMGSKCLIIPTGEVYILNSSNQWVKIGG
jgi:hypothetical protein